MPSFGATLHVDFSASLITKEVTVVAVETMVALSIHAKRYVIGSPRDLMHER